MRADDRLTIRRGGTMHRDVFAENIMVADAHTRRFAVVFQILRRVADDAAGVKNVVRADLGDAGEIDVRSDDAVRAEFHVRVNHGIRPDVDGGVQFRLRMNDGGRMNHLAATDSHKLPQMENSFARAGLSFARFADKIAAIKTCQVLLNCLRSHLMS